MFVDSDSSNKVFFISVKTFIHSCSSIGEEEDIENQNVDNDLEATADDLESTEMTNLEDATKDPIVVDK